MTVQRTLFAIFTAVATAACGPVANQGGEANHTRHLIRKRVGQDATNDNAESLALKEAAQKHDRAEAMKRTAEAGIKPNSM